MKRFCRENGLTLAMLAFFLVSFAGQTFSGLKVYNENLKQDHELPVALKNYLTTGHFMEATFENWESEYLQMGLFVLLTAFLYQKGSPDSRKLFGGNAVDEDPEAARDRPDAPGPVKRGGAALALYQYSLTLTLLSLFAVCFLLHAAGGRMEFNREAALHHEPTLSYGRFLVSPDFWFQSFQNWQSEFLSIASLTVLSIFLRHKGSPQSKPVAESNAKTGE